MKIKTRDIGLLGIGLILGAILVASLTTTPTQPSPPASSLAATGRVLATLSPQVLGMAISNIQWAQERGEHRRRVALSNMNWEAPPRHIEMSPKSNDHSGLPSPVYRPMHPSVDLIDLRYQPDTKLDDVR